MKMIIRAPLTVNSQIKKVPLKAKSGSNSYHTQTQATIRVEKRILCSIMFLFLITIGSLDYQLSSNDPLE